MKKNIGERCILAVSSLEASNVPFAAKRSIYLQLSEGETTASTNTAVVLDGRAPDNGTQLVDGARSNGGGLGDTGLTTAVLAAGLKIREKKRMLVDQVLSSKKISHSMPVGRE